MNIEYEATFLAVDKEDVRRRLEKAGAKLIKPSYLQKRIVFELPSGHEIPGGWLRVRDEKDKVTMSLKVVSGDRIEDQKEICLEISDFQTGVAFLEAVGARQKAYQENLRELWRLEKTEITIDEWPYLKPYVEIEGPTEMAVKEASAKLGFDYGQALFGSVDTIYHKEYGTALDYINHQLRRITFDEPNPFLEK